MVINITQRIAEEVELVKEARGGNDKGGAEQEFKSEGGEKEQVYFKMEPTEGRGREGTRWTQGKRRLS